MYYGGKRWFETGENRIDGRKISCWKRFTLALQDMTSKRLMNCMHPKGWASAPDYDVSICAIFKNEGPYLREWIEYHLGIGVDHIYMYNNNSDDGYQSIIAPFIQNGRVELIDWPQNHAQLDAYRDCLKRCSEKTRWIGFIDLDEFVVLKENKSIYEFLVPFEKNRPAVVLYWKVFGSSGLTDRDMSVPVTQVFRYCNPVSHVNGKCFFNNLYEPAVNLKKGGSFHHRICGRYKGLLFPPVNCFDYISSRSINMVPCLNMPACLHHYCVKSLREYENRIKKTDVFYEVNPHDMAYFHCYDDGCTAYDESIQFTYAENRQS